MRLRHLIRFAAVAAAGLVTLTVAPLPATAEVPGPGSVGVRPSDERDYFHVHLLPGQTSRRTAVVTNLSASPVDLLVSTADATLSPQGGFALSERNVAVRQVGAWIRLPFATLHLAPHQASTVTFPLTVPSGVEPGDYYGGIVVQPVDPSTASTVQNGFSVQLNIIQRIGVRVYLHVDGRAQPGLHLGNVVWHRDSGGMAFEVPISNTGNVGLHPTAALRMSGFHLPGHPVSMSPVDVLLPGTSVTVTGRVADPPGFGYGEAVVRVDDGRGEVVTARTPIRLVPVLPVLGIVGGLLLLLFAAWRFARFVARARAALRLVQPDQPAPTRTRSSRFPDADDNGRPRSHRGRPDVDDRRSGSASADRAEPAATGPATPG